MKNYNITLHALERLQERLENLEGHFSHIYQADFRKKRSLNYIIESFRPIFDEIISCSCENKSILNNTAYLIEYYEKYGYDKIFTFYDCEKFNITLLFKKLPSEKFFSIVTVLPFKGIRKKKYNKIPTKEIKKSKKIENWYLENQDIIKHYEKMDNNLKNVNHKSEPCIIDKDGYLIEDENNCLMNKLLYLLQNNKAERLEKISNTVKKYKTVLDNTCYTFIKKDKTIQILEELHLT